MCSTKLREKTVFSPTVQYTCVVLNLEKKQYFPKSCSIFEVFSLKTVQILQKSNTWHLCMGYTSANSA